jgi:oligopeptide/dipeptide ABC transporter ATP-binding protein
MNMHFDAKAPALKVENLNIRVLTETGLSLKIVDDINFSIGAGEFFALVGESGSGKTMIARAVMRLLPDAIFRIEGSIRFGDQEIGQAPERVMRQLRGAGISMIFQEPMSSLNPLMTVEQQIGEAISAHSSVGSSEKKARIRKLLTDVRFREPDQIMRKYPHELSGGMRQRVMIAMALVNTPKLLIADEPTTALDVTIQKEVLDILGRLSREYNLAVLLISHDLSLVHEYADRIAVLYGGVLMEQGPTRQVIEEPAHPYTAALIACVPNRRRDGKRQEGIEGSVPGISSWPPGCRFRERCGYAVEACAQSVAATASPDRSVRCVAPLGRGGEVRI